MQWSRLDATCFVAKPYLTFSPPAAAGPLIRPILSVVTRASCLELVKTGTTSSVRAVRHLPSVVRRRCPTQWTSDGGTAKAHLGHSEVRRLAHLPVTRPSNGKLGAKLWCEHAQRRLRSSAKRGNEDVRPLLTTTPPRR